MSWEWVAGHVKDVSQDELIDLVRHTMASLSNKNIIETERGSGNGGPYSKAQQALMISVSPSVNGWVTYWGYNHRFCSSIIRHNRLDGILFHGFSYRVPFDIEYIPENYCDYMYWEAGSIVDWFISDVPNYFAGWINETQRDIVLPYFLFHELDKSVPGLTEITDQNSFYQLIKENANLFEGDWDIFVEALEPTITKREFREWQSQNVLDAIKAIPHITNLPYSGLEYSIEMIGIYEELRHNIANPMIGSSYWVKEIEKQSTEWKEALPTFKHIYFEYGPGVDRNQILWENYDLFWYSF